MPAWPSQKRSGLEEAYPVVPVMPCSLLIEPDGILTERPLHFSVKNIVPSFKNETSHGESNLPTTTSVDKTGAAAKTAPEAAKPSEAIATLIFFDMPITLI